MLPMKVLDSKSDEFATPSWLFNPFNEEFHFTLDAAATKENAKLPKYYTKEDDALGKSWAGERVWCNPPYSRGNIENFFMKAYYETKQSLEEPCQLVALLIPTHTERHWFHNLREAFEVRFIRGRIKFDGGSTTARDTHMLLILRSKKWTNLWIP
jgi:phage N-6-adenine-methyltransferase